MSEPTSINGTNSLSDILSTLADALHAIGEDLDALRTCADPRAAALVNDARASIMSACSITTTVILHPDDAVIRNEHGKAVQRLDDLANAMYRLVGELEDEAEGE